MDLDTAKQLDGTIPCVVKIPTVKSWGKEYAYWKFDKHIGAYRWTKDEEVILSKKMFKLKDQIVKPSWDGKNVTVNGLAIHPKFLEILKLQEIKEPSRLDLLEKATVLVKNMSETEIDILVQVLTFAGYVDD